MTLHIELNLDPTVNFAMQQNDVPVVKAIRLHNASEAELRELGVQVWGEPEFMVPWSGRVAAIAPGGTYNLELPEIELSATFLLELTERLVGAVHVEVVCDGQTGAQLRQRIEVLAHDQWSGMRSLPEMLTAFILPNHPAIETLLAEAARILEQWTGDASLSGYQTRSRERVLQMTAAIFTALQRQSITYINPPASFEQEGQKIRLPDRLLAHKMGTCLDLTLLMTACLEQAGLHPLVVCTEGHAFAGVWLDAECFADCATDEITRLRKRIDLGEICTFETTLLTQPTARFEQAVSESRRKLEDEELFRCVIDVARARRSRIRPLPSRAGMDGQVDIVGDKRQTVSVDDPGVPPTLTLPEPQFLVDAAAGATPPTRLDLWKRKLLDLTLNNRLINFRESLKTIPLLCPDLAALEDALAEGETFSLDARPAAQEEEQRSTELHRRRTGDDIPDAFLREELQARRLHADVAARDLPRRLIELYRAARTSLEESGASTLYLALGFLQWFESPLSQQPRLAPILLVPLTLERRFIREGFRICQGDDEPRVNTTLLELLARDFGIQIAGLDPLPQDAQSIDVASLFYTLRRAIRDFDRWDVIEHAHIGLFSFTKFLMWRDLQEHTDALVQNKVVAHLVHRPNEPFPVAGTFPEPARLDQTHRLAETFTPLSSDSSQLAAVYAAAAGHSFVLEGPPGTGKSQTITNMIAQALANGKTVLFVAEKMAALSVVHARLNQLGLGRFCLELHSNKARKLEVIEQLGQALERLPTHEPEQWVREAQKLEELRQELNQYVETLHQPHATGESIFQGLSRLIGRRQARHVNLTWEAPTSIDKEALEALRDAVERLQRAGEVCGHPARSPWAAAACDAWSPAFQREVEVALNELEACCQALHTTAGTAGPHLGLGQSDGSLGDYALLHEIAGLVLRAPAPPATFMLELDWDALQAAITEWITLGRQRDQVRQQLYTRYTVHLLQLDLDALERRLAEASQTFWPLAWFKRLGVYRALKKASQPGHKPALASLSADLKLACILRDTENVLSAAGDRARHMLGQLWGDGAADWDALASLQTWGTAFRQLTSQAGGLDMEQTVQLRRTLAQLLTEGRALVQPEGQIGRALTHYCQAFVQFNEAKQRLEALLSLQPETAWGTPDTTGAMARMRQRLGDWRAGLPGLQSWCYWRATCGDAARLGLEPLILVYEREGLPTAELMRTFERGFYQWWTESLLAQEPALRHFFSPEHERKIEQFHKLDDQYLALTCALIQARLASRVPVAGDRVIEHSEMGILQRQRQMRRRHLPIRQLFQRIPNLLPRLKPCLLMSPISVAQYLGAAHPPFDLVIFDEASQLPTWDAIGAIARGREAIIVGDPKQLPPTNFFSRSDGEEVGDDDLVEDLESILDDCIAARLPWLQLRWHYRSRHESLIAFSNSNYYDNRLLTFPAPQTDALGVCWRPVPDGVYDKGKSRTNRAEAEAIVAEILRRLRDPELSCWSIGVVTFSVPQQTLVEDLLDEARRAFPEIEAFFSPDAVEPVFVKNLENVQGDERDVILFSICYGPDPSGRVSMNFGPLNRDGGERRLNVAITRARCEVMVFSTLRPEHIDLARTRARGVADLKLFLDYAERGPAAIAEAISTRSQDDVDAPFEQQVCEALRARGYDVHTQVGCSGYRIDLAVVDPEAPGRYLLGIECDGANYHRAKTARDRDRLRETILRGLGWQLHRVWSSDWWHHPEAVLAKIDQAIAFAKSRQGRRECRPVSRAADAPPAYITTATAPTATVTPVSLPDLAPEPAGQDASALSMYTPYVVTTKLGTPDDFYRTPANAKLRQTLRAIVTTEGPMSLGLAARRLAAHWDFARFTASVQQRVEQLARRAKVRIVKHGSDLFLWPDSLEPASYRTFRIPGDSAEARREATDIPPEEIANAAQYLLSQHISLPMDDLVRETARLFGYQRTGQRMEAAIRRGIGLLLTRQMARKEGGTVIHQP
jgi:very-short-patch-repair endonuclease